MALEFLLKLLLLLVEFGGDLRPVDGGLLHLLQFGEVVLALSLLREIEQVLSPLPDVFAEHC